MRGHLDSPFCCCSVSLGKRREVEVVILILNKCRFAVKPHDACPGIERGMSLPFYSAAKNKVSPFSHTRTIKFFLFFISHTAPLIHPRIVDLKALENCKKKLVDTILVKLVQQSFTCSPNRGIGALDDLGCKLLELLSAHIPLSITKKFKDLRGMAHAFCLVLLHFFFLRLQH